MASTAIVNITNLNLNIPVKFPCQHYQSCVKDLTVNKFSLAYHLKQNMSLASGDAAFPGRFSLCFLLGRDSVTLCPFCLWLSSCGSNFSVTPTLCKQCWDELFHSYLNNEHEKDYFLKFYFHQAGCFIAVGDYYQKAQIQLPISQSLSCLCPFINGKAACECWCFSIVNILKHNESWWIYYVVKVIYLMSWIQMFYLNQLFTSYGNKVLVTIANVYNKRQWQRNRSCRSFTKQVSLDSTKEPQSSSGAHLSRILSL